MGTGGRDEAESRDWKRTVAAIGAFGAVVAALVNSIVSCTALERQADAALEREGLNRTATWRHEAYSSLNLGLSNLEPELEHLAERRTQVAQAEGPEQDELTIQVAESEASIREYIDETLRPLAAAIELIGSDEVREASRDVLDALDAVLQPAVPRTRPPSRPTTSRPSAPEQTEERPVRSSPSTVTSLARASAAFQAAARADLLPG